MGDIDLPQNKTENEPPSPEMMVEEIRNTVAANVKRVAELGQWPAYIPPESLLERIPKPGEKGTSGFDAGVASTLDLIPRDKQELAAKLHAAYTKEAVEQVRREAAKMDPESQTAYWLAASSVCKEGSVDSQEFLKQIETFKEMAADPEKRGAAAKDEFEKMTHSFEMKDGVPYGEIDGCIQGAYIAGHPFGSMYAKEYGIYFIGTYEDSLGLEDFAWGTEKDEKGRAKSGPVFGSRQYVKCADEAEWKRATEVVKRHLASKGSPESPSLEVVQDAAAEYGTVEDLFLMERLSDHIDSVEKRLNGIKYLLQEYDGLREEHEKASAEEVERDGDIDPDAHEIRAEEELKKDEEIRKVLEAFEINGKSINLMQFSDSPSLKDVYNQVVLEVNSYRDTYLPARREPRPEELQ